LTEVELQLRFDDGHQQRYFSDRRALLQCVLRVAAQSADPRFEIWAPGDPVRLADGREAGKRFELKEVLDLNHQPAREQVAAELNALERAEDTSQA
jgi:hypothetical protein